MVAVGTTNKETFDETISLFDVTLHLPLDRPAVAIRVRRKTTSEQLVLRDVRGPLRGQPLPKRLVFDKEGTVAELFLHILSVFRPRRKKAMHDGQSFFDSHTWNKIEFGSMIGEAGSGQSQFGYTGSRKHSLVNFFNKVFDNSSDDMLKAANVGFDGGSFTPGFAERHLHTVNSPIELV